MNIVESLEEYIDKSIMRNKNGETYISMSVTDAHEIIDIVKELEEIKPQLTLEELRDQFEEEYNWENSSWHKSSYANGTVQIQWESYISCAKANNILREG